jgi:hypothetical protein
MCFVFTYIGAGEQDVRLNLYANTHSCFICQGRLPLEATSWGLFLCVSCLQTSELASRVCGQTPVRGSFVMAHTQGIVPRFAYK